MKPTTPRNDEARRPKAKTVWHPLAFGFRASSFTALAASLLTLTACVTGNHTTTTEEEVPPCCRKVVAASAAADRSLYQLESAWTSDVGREVKLSVFQGRPQVVALFFSHCEFACPILVHDMKRIEAALPVDLRDKVDFLLVSIDTERDTPAALHAYRARQELPLKNWSLLTGDADDVRELAALLGVNYQKDARGQFAHSNLITLLNKEGEIAYQVQGLNQPVDDMVMALRKEETSTPSSNKPIR
jgi:protein SCO1/2